MAFDPILADIRFGCGLSPAAPPADSAGAMLATLTGPDDVARAYPIEDYMTFMDRVLEHRELAKIRRADRGSPEALAAKKGMQLLNKDARIAQAHWLTCHLARRITTTAPLRERLTWFWADHFTVGGKQGLLRRVVSPYIESAIRPNITGRFEDLLVSAVTHPGMLTYLDQYRSSGPNSPFAAKRKDAGLNENLAREILELHTLGVDGPYSQTDVRELAELLTGMTMQPEVGRKFRKDMAEPGAETVLGKSYGGGPANMRDIEAALRDLARHPVTARHLSGKLARHFVSDTPDPALVTALEQALLDNDGQLMPVYEALLTHPAAYEVDNPNVKPPLDFVGSALRALQVPPESLTSLEENQIRLRIQYPMVLMGHVWEKPDGPDGLPEEDGAWVTPQGLAARLQWAITVPQLCMKELPDPRDFVTHALGPLVTPAVRFAAQAAESRADGVGLVLASPAFQRM